MKICTFRVKGETTDRPGLILENYVIDINAYCELFKFELDIKGSSIPKTVIDVFSCAKGQLNLLRRIMDHVKQDKVENRRKPIFRLEDVILRSPVPEPGVVFTVCTNYTTILAQIGKKAEELSGPGIQPKTGRAAIGPGEPIILPSDPNAQIYYEGELGVVIGQKARNVKSIDAYEYVAGYTIGNDVLCYNLFHRDQGLASFAKSFDTFAPFGPVLVTRDEIPDPHALDIETKVNGKVTQRGNTKDMVFKVPDIIRYISSYMTIEPGDVIFTGTPVRSSALSSGDLVEISIEKIGTLRNPVK